ncbi:hypothetical protein BDL97_12G107400 [Sphagnum fallax]|nr:hypothetical protein BDL97_12G107400 [Sphagnum fallax]
MVGLQTREGFGRNSSQFLCTGGIAAVGWRNQDGWGLCFVSGERHGSVEDQVTLIFHVHDSAWI